MIRWDISGSQSATGGLFLMSARAEICWQTDHRLTAWPQWQWWMFLCFRLQLAQIGHGRNMLQMACRKKGLLILARGASICTWPLRWDVNGVTAVGNIWGYILSFLALIVNKTLFGLAKQHHLCLKGAFKDLWKHLLGGFLRMENQNCLVGLLEITIT